MAWSESKAWNKGTINQDLYQALLDHAESAPAPGGEGFQVREREDNFNHKE